MYSGVLGLLREEQMVGRESLVPEIKSDHLWVNPGFLVDTTNTLTCGSRYASYTEKFRKHLYTLS